MKFAAILGSAVLLAIPLRANECIAAKNPLSVSQVCGRIRDFNGALVPNAEMQLEDAEGKVLFTAQADSGGNFRFDSAPTGEFYLTTKTPGWHVASLIKVTGSKASKVCSRPLLVTFGIGSCGGNVGMKGYHPKF